MKLKIFFCLFFLSFLGFSQIQPLDLKAIKSNLFDSKSPYNYEKLIYKFKGIPSDMDSTEAQHLYYGRNFSLQPVLDLDSPEFKAYASSFRDKDFKTCIASGPSLLAKDSTNLDVLLILFQSYDMSGDQSNAAYYFSQLRLLLDAIKFSGDGKTEKTPFVVNSVHDEYLFLDAMNKPMNDYVRGSKKAKDGMLDVWSKDSDKVFVKVLYLTKL